MKNIVLAGIVAMGLAAAQTPTGPIMSFTATTDKVAGAPDTIRIDLLRWSTDAERDQLVSAWTNPVAPAAAGRGGRGRGAAAPDPAAGADDAAGAGGGNAGTNAGAAAGGGRGGRGAVPAAGAAGAGGAAAAAGAGRGGGRGGAGGGGGGRGGGRGGAAAPDAPPPTPESSLATALGKAQTVGHLWSSEVAGYSIRSAVRMPAQDGSERIILVTERRLGAFNDLWKPVGSEAATNYEFSVIELHLNAKGEGEGRTSLTGKVTADKAAKTIALENYNSMPVVFKSVKRK